MFKVQSSRKKQKPDTGYRPAPGSVPTISTSVTA